jgi:predicted flap endonuclease-1-like 5' DNA nuclease/uncharacterized protein YicC (UPF0701 family)
MGRFLEEFASLKHDIDESAALRMSYINGLSQEAADMKKRVAEMQAHIRDSLEEMARTQRWARTEFLFGLRTQVANLRSGFQQERIEAGRRTKETLNATLTNIQGFVSDLSHLVSAKQAAFRDNRMEAADSLRRDLQDAMNSIRKSVADWKTASHEMQDEFREARKERSKQLADDLDGTLSQLRGFTTELTETVTQMLSGFREQRMDLAQSARSERMGFVSDLAESVAQIREKVTEMRSDLASDLAGARAGRRRSGEAQGAASTHEQEAPEGTGPMATQTYHEPEPESHREPESEESLSLSESEPALADEAQSEAPDDLTLIQGIGPGRLRQLNDAGIHTFAQLARSSIESLKEALGESSRLVDVSKWIEQAREML